MSPAPPAGPSAGLTSSASTRANYFVYIVRCRDGSLYTGTAKDLESRIAKHNKGTGAKYTRSRRPVSLVYFETVEGRGAGLRREAQIKKLSREEKLTLMRKNSALPLRFPKK